MPLHHAALTFAGLLLLCDAAAATMGCAPARPRATPAPSRCDALALYDDTLSMAQASGQDWNKVYACASASADDRVLMMLYANGTGVVRDLARAAAHACRIDAPAAETRARLAHLRRVATSRSPERVDLCDDAAGAATRAVCAGLAERHRDAQRREGYAALTASWSVGERSAFENARQAAYRFARHRADFETDHGDSAGNRLTTESLAAELDRFSADVAYIARGATLQQADIPLRQVENQMWQAFQRFQESPARADSYLGSIRKNDVERTQQAWQAYRDALAELAAVKTSAPADAWKILLTERRLRQLTELDDAANGR